MDVGADQHVLHDAEAAEQLQVLKGAGDAEAGHGVGGEGRDVLAADLYAAVMAIQAGDAVEGGALAGAVGADEGVDGPGHDAQGEPVDGHQAAEAQGDVLQLDRGGQLSHGRDA